MKSTLIPDKLYFSIGEVSRLADIPEHVLRYWETEFGNLRPRRDKSGRRTYQKKDLELILEIKHLLYAERYSIAGAKKKFRRGGAEKKEKKIGLVVQKEKVGDNSREKALESTLKSVQKDLEAMLRVLSE